MVLLKTENLTFTYPNSGSAVLNGVNLEINRGEFVLLMGPTGCGKTTLLRLLKKELAPFGKMSGTIVNQSLNTAFVMQNPDTSFVAENVRSELAFALENQKMKNEDIAVKIGETASFFNLADMLDKKLCELSGGERAVTAIAAAMISDADTLILDEPLAQLDPKSSTEIINLLRRVNKELGVTVLLSSHTSNEIIDFCDRLMIMDSGNVVMNGSPYELRNDDNALAWFPVYTSMLENRPLSVKEAIPYADVFCEKQQVDMAVSKTAVMLKNVTFAYGRNERDILSRLCFTAYSGKIHSIIGANGSGKTTLLKIIAGIKAPYGGKVRREGTVSYMPQNPQYLFTKDTVGEEIDADTAEAFGLTPFLMQHPYDLSGGQMQKLALAILSKQNFDILLLDEPSKALDCFSKKELADYLKKLSSLGKTVILVSHDLDFVGDISDYVSFLSDGIITITGERRKVLSALRFYTTQIRRITRNYLDSAVSAEDIL